MARNTQNSSNNSSENSNSANSSSSSANSSTQPATNTGNKNILMYIAIAVVVVVVIAIAYYEFSSLGSGKGMSSTQILSNISSSNLNQTQALFVNDLKKSEGVSNLYVSYYSASPTEHITQSSNLTIAISSNQTIDSYKLGNYNRTAIINISAYTNSKNGDIIEESINDTYYYNTNTTVTCFNDTSSTSGLVTNSSLGCANGDQGLSYLEETPFTALNVSALGYLVFNSTVTYGGIKTIAGRSCDSFIISNATTANLESNYSVFNLCLDTQYGVPLYLNQTDVVSGLQSSFSFTAKAVAANVTSSDFVIPQSYLNTIQKSII